MPKPSLLFVIFGPSGVGKTTVAEVIAKKFKIKIFSTDQIRRSRPFKKQMAGFQKNGRFFPYQLRRQFYQTLIAHGKQELTAGRHVILDATFSAPWMWQLAKRLAKTTGATLIPIEVIYQNISDAQIQKRLQKRFKKDPGAALPKIHWVYKNRFASLPQKHYLINNDGSLAELKKQISSIIDQIT